MCILFCLEPQEGDVVPGTLASWSGQEAGGLRLDPKPSKTPWEGWKTGVAGWTFRGLRVDLGALEYPPSMVH